jgi:hypothetical protein
MKWKISRIKPKLSAVAMDITLKFSVPINSIERERIWLFVDGLEAVRAGLALDAQRMILSLRRQRSNRLQMLLADQMPSRVISARASDGLPWVWFVKSWMIIQGSAIALTVLVMNLEKLFQLRFVFVAFWLNYLRIHVGLKGNFQRPFNHS